MLRWSSQNWARIWREISKGYKYRISKVGLFCMLKCIWKVIQECIPTSKSWFSNIRVWTINNHKEHDDYVKSIVKTLLLCQLRPECNTTLGAMPQHIIYNIIPWLLQEIVYKMLPLKNSKKCMQNQKHMCIMILTVYNCS